MKQQINFNTLGKQIVEQCENNNINIFEFLVETIESMTQPNMKECFQMIDDQKYDEIKLINLLKLILAQCYNQNIDLNKYFPLFVEI